MKLVRIIAGPRPALYAIRYEDCDKHEIDRIFDLWNDPEYLKGFFEANQGDLRGFNRFHNASYSIEQAIEKTIEDACDLEELILAKAELGHVDPFEALQTLFRPLNDMESGLHPLQRSKGRLEGRCWLRIYAVRIDKNLYVVTGGAIKLTKTMEERDHTNEELNKLNHVVDYLRDRGLVNEKEFARLELGA